MKTFLFSILMSAFLLVAGSAFAFNVPTPTGYVTDTTGKLTASQVSQLNQRLTDYQRRTKNEIAVLMIPTLGGENLEDVTHQVFQTFKVGKAGLDNGVLLLVVLNDHKMRLQTGKGVEGDITDIQSNDILASMKTPFRAGNFYIGISTAVDQIQARLDSRSGQKADPGTGQQFNQPVPQPSSSSTSASPNQNNSCSVGTVGNVAGFGFGLLALMVAGIALARRWIRKNEHRKMVELEAKIDAEIEAERMAVLEEKQRVARQNKHQEMLKAERAAEMEKIRLQAKQEVSRLKAPVAPKLTSVKAPVVKVAAVAAVAATVSIEESERLRRERVAREAKQKLDNELEEQRASARRERLAEERRAEDRRREASAASYSSSSSSSSWSGSDSGGSDSGFGGGDSGGGGSSSDW